MKPIITLAVLFVACLVMASVGVKKQIDAQGPTNLQEGFMVWDGACFGNLVKGPKTKVIAPFVGGEPDMSQMLVVDIQVTSFKPDCGHIEVRRGK